MSLVREAYNGYIALLDAVIFNGKMLGNISDEGVDFGGEDAQTFEIWAAQVRNTPVDELKTRDATLEISGKMIHLLPHNLRNIYGGTVNGQRWNAPAAAMEEEGLLKVLSGTGGTVEIARAKLSVTPPRGGLGGDKTLGANFSFKMLAPDDGSDPYSIYPTEAFLEASVSELAFEKAGGEQVVEFEASGPFKVGNVPDGFSVEVSNGHVVVVATANTTSSARTGNITFTLASDPAQSVTVGLTQAAS